MRVMILSYLHTVERFTERYPWLMNPGISFRDFLYQDPESGQIHEGRLFELSLRVGALIEPLLHACGVISNTFLAIVLLPVCLKKRVSIGALFVAFASIGNILESIVELPSKMRNGCAYKADPLFFPRILYSLSQWLPAGEDLTLGLYEDDNPDCKPLDSPDSSNEVGSIQSCENKH